MHFSSVTIRRRTFTMGKELRWLPLYLLSVLRNGRLPHQRKALGMLALVILLVLFMTIRRPDVASPDKLSLNRNLYDQETWPAIEYTDDPIPDQMPSTVHYVWCGEKEFQFQHYLGLLSVIRLLQPLKIVFHYTHLPVIDSFWYYTWFTELKQSFANLEVHKIDSKHPCGSRQLLVSALDFLQQHGGVYIGESVILTRFPTDALHKPFWFALSDRMGPNTTQGILIVKKGFGLAKKAEYSELMSSTKGPCSSVKSYDVLGAHTGATCILALDKMHPRDVWDRKTPFGELARWLYYGKRGVQQVQKTESAIPRIGHVTWLSPDGASVGNKFQFFHFLSVLSALHVAGLRHVYVHGELEPRGQWWEALKGENVTFVPTDSSKVVFQQNVGLISHRSDIARANILYKYGGIYQDVDTLWVNQIPEWLLHYPTVACPDWPQYGDWPEAFNTGILMSQAQAPWLEHFLYTFQYFRDENFEYNAIIMPYRVYEMYPDTLYVDRYLQVICFHGICHPVWHDDYRRDVKDKRPIEFDWLDARAYHLTRPKPPPSLASVATVRTSIMSGAPDMYARVARHILTQAGRIQMLDV